MSLICLVFIDFLNYEKQGLEEMILDKASYTLLIFYQYVIM